MQGELYVDMIEYYFPGICLKVVSLINFVAVQ